MHRSPPTRRLARAGAVALTLSALVAPTARADASTTTLTSTESFTNQGCSTWTVPTGVTSVGIEATGSAGQTQSEFAPGGSGDVVSGTLSGLSSGQALHVCVNAGGASSVGSTYSGGAGGGASGVALGSDFTSPVLIAAGGGGGGVGGLASGGNAGRPSGSAGELSVFQLGGGGATQTAGGGGGRGDCTPCPDGSAGAGVSSLGPGRGGDGGAESLGGGGGGAGYYGGGGGGSSGGDGATSGGGGGGSDFCATSTSLTGCAVTATNASYGTASVVLTYTRAGYSFSGFFSPIDNDLVNAAKAGQAIPVRWHLEAADGTPVSDPASFTSLTSQSAGGACAGQPSDAIETYTGGSGLQYLGNGNWQFNWKTPKSYAGQCRTMTLTLTDNSTHPATLQFN